LPKSPGRLTQSSFIPYTSKAISGTEGGDIVLWDVLLADSLASSTADQQDLSGRQCVKAVRYVFV